MSLQAGYLAKHGVSEEDKVATEQITQEPEEAPQDPMQGLEGLDVAGPQPTRMQ